jgi:hypothetical protein
VLENLDSISILIKHGSTDPCKSLLRNALESFFQLEFILEKDTVNRALGFMLCYYHNEYNGLKKYNPSDPSHKIFIQKLKQDKSIIPDAELPFNKDIEDRLNWIPELFKQTEYEKIERIYQNLLDNGVKVKNWYQLFGIKNIEQLSIHLQRRWIYESLYRGLSGQVHSIDIIEDKLEVTKEGYLKVNQLRSFKNAQSVVYLAVTIGLFTFKAMTNLRLKKYEPRVEEWYSTIRNKYLQLSQEKLLKFA